MEIANQMLRQIESDLGLNTAFVKGADLPVKNCWHFCTDGNAVDVLFHDNQDFVDGMNRIYTVSRKFSIVILAHVLMDTHVHFVIYGEHGDCNAFIHEYLRLTSMHIARKHDLTRKLKNLPVSCQHIGNDFYLKTAICYVIKNPTAAGLKFTPYDYPWSSGALYFRSTGFWTSPCWAESNVFSNELEEMSSRTRQYVFKTKSLDNSTRMSSANGLIFPGEYVGYSLVERIFRTCRSFNYFMGTSKEDDLNPLATIASHLSIPVQEMRQNRDEACIKLFGRPGIRTLNVAQRIKLAKMLRSRFSCSTKQIARVCGLVHDEVKGII